MGQSKVDLPLSLAGKVIDSYVRRPKFGPLQKQCLFLLDSLCTIITLSSPTIPLSRVSPIP